MSQGTLVGVAALLLAPASFLHSAPVEAATSEPASTSEPVRTTGLAVEGRDRLVADLPQDTADRVEPYTNAGYRLRRHPVAADASGVVRVEVEISLEPIGSEAPFVAVGLADAEEGAQESLAGADSEVPPSATGEVPEVDPVAALARQITAKSIRSYGAVSSLLGWMVANVVTAETAALLPPTTGGEAGVEPPPSAPAGEPDGAEESPPSSPAATLAAGSGDAREIAELAVALLGAVGIEARSVEGDVVGEPAVGEPRGRHTWIEVRYPDVGWVFSDPLHHHHYVPASYLRRAPGEVGATEPPGASVDETSTEAAAAPLAAGLVPGDLKEVESALTAPRWSPIRLVERQDLREIVDLYPLGGPGVTARRNRPLQRAGALRVVVSGPHRGSAVLQGGAGRSSRVLVDGESVFVGLTGGAYRLEVYLENRAPIVRELEIRPRERRAVFLRGGGEGEAVGGDEEAGQGGPPSRPRRLAPGRPATQRQPRQRQPLSPDLRP